MSGMSNREAIFSMVGAFIATLLASFMSYTILEEDHIPMVLASTGASAVLIFALPHSPVSQPWNLVGGQMTSAFVGISCLILIDSPVLASSVAIVVSMVLMHLLRCMHPPGGATAVTAAIGSQQIENLGYAFIVVPVFLNAIILLSIAMAVGVLREKNPFYQETMDHPGF